MSGTPTTASRSERRQAASAVAALLVRHGLRPGPRGGSGPLGQTGPLSGIPFEEPARLNDGTVFGDRLRSALEELGASFGNAFPIFGSYLSRRPDLLPPADCLALATIQAPLIADSDPFDRAFGDLGGRKQILTRVAPRPRRRGPVRLQFQAFLQDEHPVLVEIVPEELVLELSDSLPRLALLKDSWEHLPIATPFATVLEEFRPWLEAELDLGPALADLEAFAQNPEGSRRLSLPRPFAYLCGPRRLVLEDPGGSPLGASSPASEPGSLARRITLAWLVQTMVTRSYVGEISEADLVQLPRQGLALRSGGPLYAMPEEDQANWWSYLQAAAADDPGAASTWLLRECIAVGPEADEGELQLRLRQVVPFRDGSWTEDGETLAEKLFLHWRIARDCGFRLRPRALSVAQGIFAIAALGRSLDPQGDPLRNALEDLRWMTGWSQMRQWANMPHMARLLERNAEALMELPARVEALLDRPAPAPLPQPPAAPDRRGAIASLVALVAGTLLIDHLADGGLFGAYGEPVKGLVFLVIALFTLRMLWRCP